MTFSPSGRGSLLPLLHAYISVETSCSALFPSSRRHVFHTGEAIARFLLGFWCVPVLHGFVFFSLLAFLLQVLSLLDLVVPKLYFSNVSGDGGSDPFMGVEQVCRALGLPRLAPMMASSSAAALLLAAFRRSPRVWVVACLGADMLSSSSSVIWVAPRWNSCSSCRLCLLYTSPSPRD